MDKEKEYYTYITNDDSDTVSNVASRYNVHPELLANMNGLERNDYIYKDQTILIPKGGYSFYITKEGDTLNAVAQLCNSTKEEILHCNEIVYLLAGQLLASKRK